MNAQELIATARALVAGDKGLLAMDESTPTCNKRFAKWGIPQTEEARRGYRELIATAPGLGESISGAILYDETIRQKKKDGTPFVKVLADAGIIPGIKVDTGAKDLAAHPGEKITEGLDGLRARLAEYFQMGARFAKWRAVIAVGDGIPSRGCIEANAQALARYAALCQEAGLVPVVEPEVLMDGDHTMERCREVTEEVLRTVFTQLYAQRVMLEGMILKPNMVLPGSTCPTQETVDAVADATVRCLLRTCVLVGRPIRRTGLGPFECHECPIQVAIALGVGIFVCPRHSATGSRDLARPRGERVGGPASSESPSQVQPGGASGRIQCRDRRESAREGNWGPIPMNEAKHSSHQHGTPARESIQHNPDPYWRRAHRDWKVWVGLFFMMAAITIYVMSNDLSFFPRGQPRQPVSDARGK